MDIGRRIKDLRLQRGMTQEEVAGGELSRAYISSVEHGRCRPSEKALARIAESLGVPVDVLSSGDQPQKARAVVRHLLRTARLSQSISYREKVGLLQYAAGTAKSIADSALLAEVYEQFGDIHYRHEDFHKAQGAYGQAISYYWEGATSPGSRHARIQLKLGHCLFDAGEFAVALRHYRNAQEILTRTGRDRALLTKALRNLGNVSCRLGSFEQALLHYAESKKLAEVLTDSAAAAHATLGISYALLGLGRASEAYSAAKEAEQRYAEEADEFGVTTAKHNMAAAGIILGKQAESETMLNAAIQFYQAQGQPELESAAFEELAHLKRRQGSLASALEQCRRGLAVLDGRPKSVAWCRLTGQLGLLEVEQKLVRAGVEHIRESAEGFVQLGEAHEVARLLERVIDLLGWKEVEA